MKFTEMQHKLKFANKEQLEEISIVALSNINLEPYLNQFINDKFSQSRLSINVIPINYEEYQFTENMNKFNNDSIVVVCINFEYLFPNAVNDIFSNKSTTDSLFEIATNQCEDLYRYIKENTQAPIIWLGFDDYCYQYNYVKGNIIIINNTIDKINNSILKMVTNQDVYIDLKHLIANVGIKNAYDNKGKYRWNSTYSQKLILEMCSEIYKQYLIQNGSSKKCIVLDCDNVLWGGILSEDGIENLLLSGSGLGRFFQDFQRYLLTLYYHGIILTVCSKNDLYDVMTMFRKHSEMILKEEHISCFQVNWNNKVDNIKRISETLNIGLDTIVFIDDSDFEIELVKEMLPEVTTILLNRDTVYEQLSCFNLRNHVDIEKVKQRNYTYKTNEQREVLKVQFRSFEKYLKALEVKVDIHEALPIEYSRIAELTQRTNKCTNGKRYTVCSLKEKLLSNDYKLYSVLVSDKFSDLGLVGVIGIDNKTLDLFSLSCRALGRSIEDKMLELILKYNVSDFVFITTGKNQAIESMLERSYKLCVLTKS